MATGRKVRRVRPTVLKNDFAAGADDGFPPLPPPPKEPLPPVDEVYPRPPKSSPARYFAALIDPVILLSEDAQRRIEKALRQAVLAEIAQLDFGSDIMVRSIGGGGGTAGIELFARRMRK